MIYTSEKAEQVVLRISEMYQKVSEKNCNGKLLNFSPKQELNIFLLHLQQIQTFVTFFMLLLLYYFIILSLNINVIII